MGDMIVDTAIFIILKDIKFDKLQINDEMEKYDNLYGIISFRNDCEIIYLIAKLLQIKLGQIFYINENKKKATFRSDGFTLEFDYKKYKVTCPENSFLAEIIKKIVINLSIGLNFL